MTRNELKVDNSSKTDTKTAKDQAGFIKKLFDMKDVGTPFGSQQRINLEIFHRYNKNATQNPS